MGYLIGTHEQPKSFPIRTCYKVRCASCGVDSWWGKSKPWICRRCGGHEGTMINLLVEELRGRHYV